MYKEPKSVRLYVGNIEPKKHNTLQWHSLHSTQLTPFILDEVRSECEQTIAATDVGIAVCSSFLLVSCLDHSYHSYI